MNDINTGTGSNVGSIQAISVYFQSDITSVWPLTLKAGKSKIGIFFVRHEAMAETTEIPTEQGTHFETNITFSLSKGSAVLQNSVLQLQGRKLIVVATDNNREKWLFGDLEEYGTMSRKKTSGTSPDQRNEYQITLNFKQAKEPFAYPF